MTDPFVLLCRTIRQSLSQRGRMVLALEGCCASGKTTLAGRLAEYFDADMISMDDFFLPLSLRSPKRLAEPGGNVHYERFLTQIIQPLLRARENDSKACPVLSWNRFDCSVGAFSPVSRQTRGRSLLIIEGAYSMREEFRAAYDCTVFLTVSPGVQKQRILTRNGTEGWNAFETRWIPLENRYFAAYDIPGHCMLCLENERTAEAVLSPQSVSLPESADRLHTHI